MKLLFIFNGAYPGGMAASNRLHLYCKALKYENVQVKVLAPSRKKVFDERSYEGVKYSYFKNPILNFNYATRKMSSFYAAFIYSFYCFKYAKEYDTIFIYGFGWFALFLMIIGSHLGGGKVCLEVNENPYAPEGGRMDPKWIRRIRRHFMLNLPFRFSDGFIVISKRLERLVNKYRKRSSFIIRIPIICEKASNSYWSVTAKNTPYILHAGSLSEKKDGVIAMFKGFAKASKNIDVPLKFILTSKTAHKKLMKKIEILLLRYGLNNRVEFMGHVQKNELENMMIGSLTAIINKPVNDQNIYNFPTKLGEYLTYGIPVIASNTGEMRSYLENNKTAFMVEPNNSEEIAQKIIFILNNPGLSNSIGKAGKQLADSKFYYKTHSEALSNFFHKISTNVIK